MCGSVAGGEECRGIGKRPVAGEPFPTMTEVTSIFGTGRFRFNDKIGCHMAIGFSFGVPYRLIVHIVKGRKSFVGRAEVIPIGRTE